jgi:hypothetical protein
MKIVPSISLLRRYFYYVGPRVIPHSIAWLTHAILGKLYMILFFSFEDVTLKRLLILFCYVKIGTILKVGLGQSEAVLLPMMIKKFLI